MISASGGRDTTTYTVDEDMTTDIYSYNTRLVQWLTALKLPIDSWLMALSYTRDGLRPYTLRDRHEGEGLRP